MASSQRPCHAPAARSCCSPHHSPSAQLPVVAASTTPRRARRAPSRRRRDLGEPCPPPMQAADQPRRRDRRGRRLRRGATGGRPDRRPGHLPRPRDRARRRLRAPVGFLVSRRRPRRHRRPRRRRAATLEVYIGGELDELQRPHPPPRRRPVVGLLAVAVALAWAPSVTGGPRPVDRAGPAALAAVGARSSSPSGRHRPATHEPGRATATPRSAGDRGWRSSASPSPPPPSSSSPAGKKRNDHCLSAPERLRWGTCSWGASWRS